MAEEQTIAPAAQAAEGPVTRETLLAELKQLSDEAPEAETTGEQQPAKPAAEPEPEANAEEESAEESDEDTEAEAEDESPADPKTAKGIEAIKRQHKREKEKLDRDRREMELERERIVAEWKPKVEAAQQFEQFKGRAKYDPAGVLERLGLSPDDFESAARQIYARSKAAAANPQTREAAERAMRERESADRLATMERELETLRQEREHERRQQVQQKQVQTFLAGVEKATTTETPLLRALFHNDPDDAREQIAALTVELIEETGEEPDASDVVKEFEKRHRAKLKKLGIDPSAVIAAAPPKTKPSPAGETKTAKTLSNDLSTPTRPRSQSMTPEEEREDILRGLRDLTD